MEQLTIEHLGKRLINTPFVYSGKIMNTELSYPVLGLIKNPEPTAIYTFTNGEDSTHGFITMGISQYNFKLILHPLSDLTKEIEHNGEKFIPLVELAEIAEPFQKIINYRLINGDNGYGIVLLKNYKGEEKEYATLAYFHKSKTFDFYSKNKQYRSPQSGYKLFQKLIEWHFVIDEPKGTWIDVNTLETNPYK